MTQLAPGAGCEVTAAFMPRTAGVRSGGMRIDVNAAGGPLTVPLTGVAVDPGPGRLRLEPESVLFGEEVVGTTSTPKEVVARNTGGQPVTLQYFERNGLHPQDFEIDSARCPTELAPGATCPLGVTFTPTAAGARGASLVAVSDAAEDRVAAQLAGTGRGGGPGRLRPDPSALSFDADKVGTRSEPQQVVMANVGETPVTIGDVRRVGDHAADFSLDATDCQNAKLGTGQRCVITATFTPGGDGVSTANLMVSSDGAERETVVPMQGQLSESVLEVVPKLLEFGAQPVGKRTAARPLLVRNRGSAPVTVGAVKVLGEHPADFDVDSTACQRTLDPGKDCELAVVFIPGALHDRSARVVVDSDPPGRSAEAALTGSGRQRRKEIEVTPPMLDFGPHPTGTGAADSVHVTNTGEVPVTLGAPTVTADDATSARAFTVSKPCPKLTLEPRESCQVEVTFTPAAPETVYAATLNVHSDLPGPAPAVELKGSTPKAKVALIKVTPSKLPLDNKDHPSGFVKVESVGDKPATLGQIAALPSDRFRVDPPGQCSGQTLASTESCELRITFTPPAEDTADPGPKQYEGVLEVPSDASARPSTVELTGSVIRNPRALLVEPNELLFVDQAAGSESKAQFVKVASSGTEAVKIIATARTGQDADAFTVDDRECLQAPLAPGASCNLAVTFRPGNANTHYEATVEILADAVAKKTVSLKGDSRGPLPDLVPVKSVELSRADGTVTVTVANRGGAASGPTSVLLEFPGHAALTRDLVTLRPKTSTRISVTFPEACYDRCQLTVTVDDRNLVAEADEGNNQWTYLIEASAAQSAGRHQIR
jgi:hypothetical protein